MREIGVKKCLVGQLDKPSRKNIWTQKRHMHNTLSNGFVCYLKSRRTRLKLAPLGCSPDIIVSIFCEESYHE